MANKKPDINLVGLRFIRLITILHCKEYLHKLGRANSILPPMVQENPQQVLALSWSRELYS